MSYGHYQPDHNQLWLADGIIWPTTNLKVTVLREIPWNIVWVFPLGLILVEVERRTLVEMAGAALC